MTRENDRTKKMNMHKLQLTILVLLVVIILLVGNSLGWFYSSNDMATLVQITEPTEISVLGPNGKAQTALDLRYDESDKTGNKVTIRRVICIKNRINGHKIEVAHTTNMSGLSFKIFPVVAGGADSVNDQGYTYTYNSNNEIEGRELGTLRSENYGDYNESYIHTKAIPKYWVSDRLSSSTSNDSGGFHYTYYVCEISWTEMSKETDLFYILAENSASEGKQ